MAEHRPAKLQMVLGGWPFSVTDRLSRTCVNAPAPAR